MGETIPGDEDFPEPPRLRQLRRLVTALTATLIVGVITIVGAACHPPLVRRRRRRGCRRRSRLPPGERAEAVTFGSGWLAVVTVDGAGQERIRVLDRATGARAGSRPRSPPLPAEPRVPVARWAHPCPARARGRLAKPPGAAPIFPQCRSRPDLSRSFAAASRWRRSSGARSPGTRASATPPAATTGRPARSIRKSPRRSTSMRPRATTTASAATPRATPSASCARPRTSASWRPSSASPREAGMAMPARDPAAAARAAANQGLAEAMEAAVRFYRAPARHRPRRRGPRLPRPPRPARRRPATASRSASPPTAAPRCSST